MTESSPMPIAPRNLALSQERGASAKRTQDGSGIDGWCSICGEEYDWKQPNMLLVVQTGESVEQAKVFKAHSVTQGLCENLINALTLLAKCAKRMETVSCRTL